MHRRKIQLIAGTTYSVSLPKEWVRKNNLKEKNEILFYEKNDRTLVISPYAIEGKKLNEISLDIDKYISAIDQILFAVYYLGIENISLFSKKELTKDVKSRIRKTTMATGQRTIASTFFEKGLDEERVEATTVTAAQLIEKL